MTRQLTISISTHNRPAFLEILLDSIRNSFQRNSKLKNLIQVQIVHDGKQDSATKYVVSKFPDLKVQYYSIEKSGLANSRNFAALKTDTEFIRLQDDDDSRADLNSQND